MKNNSKEADIHFYSETFNVNLGEFDNSNIVSALMEEERLDQLNLFLHSIRIEENLSDLNKSVLKILNDKENDLLAHRNSETDELLEMLVLNCSLSFACIQLLKTSKEEFEKELDAKSEEVIKLQLGSDLFQ